MTARIAMTNEFEKKTEKLTRTPFQPRTKASKLISLGTIEGLGEDLVLRPHRCRQHPEQRIEHQDRAPIRSV